MEGKVARITIVMLMLPMLWGSVVVSADPPEMWCLGEDGSVAESCGVVYEGDTFTLKWECPVWTVRMELEARITFEGTRLYDPIFETEWDDLTYTEGYEQIDVPVQKTGQVESLSFRLSCFNSQDVETEEVDFLMIYPEPDISDQNGNNNGNQNSQTSESDSYFLPFVGILLVVILLIVGLIVISLKKNEKPPRQYQHPPTQ